jgi:hypothetical protein
MKTTIVVIAAVAFLLLPIRGVYSDQSDQLFRSYPTAFRSEATMV